jgi:hypothetical protein
MTAIIFLLLKGGTPYYDSAGRIWKALSELFDEVLVALLHRDKSHKLYSAVHRRCVKVAECLLVWLVIDLVLKVLFLAQSILASVQRCFNLFYAHFPPV